MRDLAIIIVSYKTRDLLEKCLASIYAGEYPFSHRVVVVDNASGDGTPEMVISKYPDALMIASETNSGFSAGNNMGIRSVDSRHVLLLNPDTEVYPETITKMVRFLDDHHHVGIVGCQLLNSDLTHQTSWFRFPLPLSRYIENAGFYPRLAHSLLGFKYRHPEITGGGARRVDIVKGACLMIRRDAVNQIGLLDENSFLYADDIDWCIRAARRGWEAYALTEDNIIHHGYASTDQEPYITITSSRRSALYLYRKHYSWLLVAMWSTMIYQEIIYKYLLNGIRLKKMPDDTKIRSKHDAYRDLMKDIFRRREISKNGKCHNSRQK